MALHCKSASEEKKDTVSSCTSAKRSLAAVARSTEVWAGCTHATASVSEVCLHSSVSLRDDWHLQPDHGSISPAVL